MSEEDPVEIMKRTFKVEGLPPRAELEVRIGGKRLIWDRSTKKLIEVK